VLIDLIPFVLFALAAIVVVWQFWPGA